MNKIKEIMDGSFVLEVRTKGREEVAAIKNWVMTNWSRDNYGKFRVAVMALIVVLAIRGIFCGWQTVEQKNEAGGLEAKAPEVATEEKKSNSSITEKDLALMALLLGGSSESGSSTSSSSSSSGPKIHAWMCRQCGNTVQGRTCPPAPLCKAWHGQNDGSCFKNCRWTQTY